MTSKERIPYIPDLVNNMESMEINEFSPDEDMELLELLRQSHHNIRDSRGDELDYYLRPSCDYRDVQIRCAFKSCIKLHKNEDVFCDTHAACSSPILLLPEAGAEFTAQVPSYGFAVDNKERRYVCYTLEVNRTDKMTGWKIFRRYREFYALDNYLRRLGFSLPEFPNKSWISNFEIDFIEERQRGLQSWLDGILKHSYTLVTSTNESSSSPIFRDLAVRKFFTDRADIPPSSFVASDPSAYFTGAKEKANIKGTANSMMMNKDPVSIESFQLIKVIGKGSFGKVMLVKKKDTGNVYAMKVLSKPYVVKRKQVEHTKTERRVLAKLTHPFIVGLHYAFQTAQKLYFVLDYCPGGELFFHLGRRGTFPENLAMFYSAEIALALVHLHKIGVVYRDLKPENILIDHYGHVKLADFGLSKEDINSHSEGTKSFCGTAEYLAPEILLRTGHGTGVDWWSLGMVIYEMLTGLPPWYTKDKAKLFHRVKHNQVRYPANISSSAKSLIEGLLIKDPNKRLGKGNGEDIKSHPFFSGLDWDMLLNRNVKPPFVPKLRSQSNSFTVESSNGDFDTSNFDSTFTKMQLSTDEGGLAASDTFDGFTYDPYPEDDEIGSSSYKGLTCSTPGPLHIA